MSAKNNHKLRIVMLAASLPPMRAGGAEMQALQLAKELETKGHDVFFITPGDNNVSGSSTVQGLTVYRLHSVFNRIFLWLSKMKKRSKPDAVQIEFDDSKDITNMIVTRSGWPTKLYYTIFFWHSFFLLWMKRKKIDIIHAHTMEWSAIVAARLGRFLRKPVIIKDSTMNGFQSLQRFPKGKKLQQMIIRNAHFVAMTSVIEKNLLQAGISPKNITLIPNGISVRQPSRIEQQGKKVLFIGNLYQQPAKGVDILLKAWVHVILHHPDAELIIAGDGVNESYHNYTKQLGIEQTVRFMGKVSNVEEHYASSNIFVLPSRREGMSNALMEAMMYEVPCIATSISGSTDLIQDKVDGILVPPANVAALAEAIIFMLSHKLEAEEMGRKARQTVVGKFNIEIVTEKYIQLYYRQLNNN